MGLLDRLLGPGDRDAFADLVARHVAAELGCPVPTYDRETFSLQFGEGDVLQLTNVWAQVEGESRSVRRRYAAGWARVFAVGRKYPIPDRFEDAIDLLLPRLRARVSYGLQELRDRAAGRPHVTVPHRVIGEHYAVEVVCDFPETVSSVDAEQAAKWGRSFDELLHFAVGNLRRRPVGAVGQMKGGTGRVVTVMSGDTYDATRLLVFDDATRGPPTVSDPVVLVPHRDAFFVTSAGDPQGLSMLAKLGREVAERPYPLAAVPIRRVGDGWEPWLPPADHPAHAELRELTTWSILRDYGEQCDVLQAALHAEMQATFVASCLWKPQERVEAISTWGDGVPTALPRTAILAFGRGDPERGESREIVMVRWEDAVAICGARMQPMGLFPERWFVESFPDEAEWTRLRAVATNRDA